MAHSLRKVNLFLLTKLPSAYLAGIRVFQWDASGVYVKVRKKWINQNPFNSLYWAVQGMASELTTGLLVMKAIEDSGYKFSMLVTHQKGTFSKKAVGKIVFSCNNIEALETTIKKAIKTGEGQTLLLPSTGVDEQGDIVSIFEYEWSLKVKI